MPGNGKDPPPLIDLDDPIIVIPEEDIMAKRRVHIPEITLNTSELEALRSVIRSGIVQWDNDETEDERFKNGQMAESVMGRVLNWMVETGRQKEVA